MLLILTFALLGHLTGLFMKKAVVSPNGAGGVAAFFIAAAFWLVAVIAIPVVMETQFGQLGNFGPHATLFAMGVFFGVKR